MPEQEGIESIRKIRHRNPAVGIIAISGGGRTRNFGFLDFARKLGANGTLSKPFTGTQLLALVETTLNAAPKNHAARSEEHTSELQSLMRISYAVFCLKNKKKTHKQKRK